MNSPWYWFRGNAGTEVPFIPADSRAVTLGDGCFESIRIWKGQSLFFQEHLNRYRNSCEVLGIKAISESEIQQAIRELIDGSGIISGRLRLTTFRKGSGVFLPETRDSETIFRLSEMSPALYSSEPKSLTISSVHRLSPGVLSSVKSISSLPFILASAEAKAKGADHAVLLNTSGRLADATGYNVFIITGNQVITPPLYEGALGGVMRNFILTRLCRTEGFETSEQELYPGEFIGAEEIFLSNVTRGIVPVSRVEGTIKGNTSKTTRLMHSLQRVVSELFN